MGKTTMSSPEQPPITAARGWIGVDSDQGIRDRLLTPAWVDLSSLRHRCPHFLTSSVVECRTGLVYAIA